MSLGELAFIVWLVNTGATYGIRNYISNKNFADIKKIIEEEKITIIDLDEVEKNVSTTLRAIDYIPIVNVIEAVKDLCLRKESMAFLKIYLQEVEKQYGIKEEIVEFDSENGGNKLREYFVGYYYEGRPVIIYFRYDGDRELYIDGENSTESFTLIAVDDQINILLHILYAIYMGSQEFIRSNHIAEAFTDTMVSNLIDACEKEEKNYTVSNLTRKKPN